MPADNAAYAPGDRVRLNRFGEWVDGVVLFIRDGLLCIEYGTHKAVTWRSIDSPGVSHA